MTAPNQSTPGGVLRNEGDLTFQGSTLTMPASKFLIVDDTDATKKIAFNCSAVTTGTTRTFNFPDITGTEVTTTGAQTLSNKTLLDTSTTVANTTDPTKAGQFLMSGVTAGQTRILTWPDFNGTLATLAGVETLTNKTITSPSIGGTVAGGATYSSPVLTTPTINGATLTGTLSGGTFTSSTLTAPTINAATLTGSISGGTVAPTVLTVPASTSLTTPTIAGATISGTFTSTATINGGTVAPTTLTVPSSTSLTTPTINGATLTGTITRTGVQYFISMGEAKVGAAAGWVVNAANNTNFATVAASQTAGTLVIPIIGLGIGWTITAFSLVGNITSAGNTATMDADLRKSTAAAAGPTDASIATMTQLSVTSNTIMSSANTNKGSLTYIVLVNENVYLKLTVTTAASTTVTLQGVLLTVSQS